MRYKLTLFSILLSTLCIFALLSVEWSIYFDYIKATGKTQALFGLTEMNYASTKFYLAGGGLIALVLAVIALRKKESKKTAKIAIIMAVITMVLPVTRIWRLLA